MLHGRLFCHSFFGSAESGSGIKKISNPASAGEDFTDLKDTAILHLKTGFPMGFQMSVMCIGQLAMQAVVNSLGTAAVAGYTAASKADQLSVLVNNAMMTAISNYVAQNFGAGRWDRIRQGVRACLIQTEAFNPIMCIGILLLRHPIVRMFLSDPTKEIYHYSDMYLTIVAPFYFVLDCWQYTVHPSRACRMAKHLLLPV